MFIMKRFIHRIPPILRNFYFVSLLFFLTWMLFFDSNDFITQIQLSSKLSDLEQTKSFYQEKIIQVKNDREALLNDKNLLEKLSREKYLMKKKGEDLFILVEE